MTDFIDLWHICPNLIVSLRAVHASLLRCHVRDVGKGAGEARAVEVCHGSGSPGNRL